MQFRKGEIDRTDADKSDLSTRYFNELIITPETACKNEGNKGEETGQERERVKEDSREKWKEKARERKENGGSREIFISPESFRGPLKV